MGFLTLLLAPLSAILIYAACAFALVGLAALGIWITDHDIFL